MTSPHFRDEEGRVAESGSAVPSAGSPSSAARAQALRLQGQNSSPRSDVIARWFHRITTLTQRRNQGFSQVILKIQNQFSTRPVDETKGPCYAPLTTKASFSSGTSSVLVALRPRLREADAPYPQLFNSRHPAAFPLLFGVSGQYAQRERMLWPQREESSDPWGANVLLQMNRMIPICICPARRIDQHIHMRCRRKLGSGVSNTALAVLHVSAFADTLHTRCPWTKPLCFRAESPPGGSSSPHTNTPLVAYPCAPNPCPPYIRLPRGARS